MAPEGDALSEPSLALRFELVRKALHLSASALPVAYHFGVPRETLLALLAAAAAVAALVEIARRASRGFGARFERVFGRLERPAERASVTGATFLIVSCLGAVALLSRDAAIASLWCASVGDPAATIVGRVWSARRSKDGNASGRKTFAGSAACAVASFTGVLALTAYSPMFAAAIAAIAAAAEAVPTRIDDNLRVAVAAGAAAQLLA